MVFGSAVNIVLVCQWCKILGYVEAECRKKQVGEFKKLVLSELNTVIKQKIC